jgi:hypothetical protein
MRTLAEILFWAKDVIQAGGSTVDAIDDTIEKLTDDEILYLLQNSAREDLRELFSTNSRYGNREMGVEGFNFVRNLIQWYLFGRI